MRPSKKVGMELRLRQKKRRSSLMMHCWSRSQHGSTNSKPLPPHGRLLVTHCAELALQGLVLIRHRLPSMFFASATADAMALVVARSRRSPSAAWNSVAKSSPLATAATSEFATRWQGAALRMRLRGWCHGCSYRTQQHDADHPHCRALGSAAVCLSNLAIDRACDTLLQE